METHSSVLAWRIPWTEEPGGLQSMGSQREGQDRSALASMLTKSQCLMNCECDCENNALCSFLMYTAFKHCSITSCFPVFV